MTEQTWAEWLKQRLDGRPNVYLVKNSGVKENGRPRIDDSRVSKWLKGEQKPSVDLALLAAEVLGADSGEALRAAGFEAAPATVEAFRREDVAEAEAIAGVSTMTELYARLEEAERDLGAAGAAVVEAETRHDALMRRLATVDLMQDSMAPEVEITERQLGRRLTRAERMEIAGRQPRPSPARVGEWIAWSASHDARIWTRFEMALVEYVFTDWPGDPRRGSPYADLEPFRERVKRLKPTTEAEMMEEAREAREGLRSTDDGEPRLSDRDDEIPAAAKEGMIEEPGEFNT